MANLRSVVGISGAAIVLIGLVLAGSGIAAQASAEQSIINCEFGRGFQNCQSTSASAANTTILAEYVAGTGLILSGVGFFLVAMAVVSTLNRRAEHSPWGPPGMSPPTSPTWTAPPPPPMG